MGLDAEIHVRLRHMATQDELNKVNEMLDLAGIYSNDDFLETAFPTQYNRFAFESQGNNFIEFNTLWRYWGPGYERGPFALIYGTLQVARACWPSGVILYGSDCDSELSAWTEVRAHEYWQHFISPEGNAYHDRRV